MSAEVTPSSVENWWSNRQAPDAPAGYPQLIEALRDVLDRVAEAVPDAALVARVLRSLREVEHLLSPAATENEWGRIWGTLDEVAGRGQALVPRIGYLRSESHATEGRVYFGSFYLGGNGAVHGGAVPLLFDDALGRMVNLHRTAVARTASLTVDYRSVTPVGRELSVRAWVEREEGRKVYAHGELWDGEVLCAEAKGLFITLRPGQP